MELTEKLTQMIQDTQERNFMWRDASVVRDLLIECLDEQVRQEREIKRQKAALDAVDRLRQKYADQTIDKGNLETCIVVTDLKKAIVKAEDKDNG